MDIKADVPAFVATSSALTSFTFDDVDVHSNNEMVDVGETVAAAEPKHIKTEQAAFEAALNAPVAFH